MAEQIIQDDPIEKLYRNASKKLDVGDLNNFKRLLSNPQSRQSIYDDLVDAYGSSVKSRIGNNIQEFTAQYGGQKKNTGFTSRFKQWWKYSFIPCLAELKWVFTGS